MIKGNVIHFHNNHVVCCKRCKCFLLIKDKTRLYSDAIIKQWYKCLLCGMSFACCSKNKNTVVDIYVRY